MKKIISLALCAATVLSMSVVFSGCGLFAKSAKGTDGAKILLARERLDEEYAGQKTNIWSEVGSFISLKSNNQALVDLVSSNASFVRYSQNGNTSTWTDFGVTSELKDDYTQFIDPIDAAAAELAKTIVHLKNNVGVTEKWVGDYLLIVKENSETVVALLEHDRIDVSTRYTTEDAKCVYEMYTFMDYSDGTTGKILNKCIPGEHYEYMFNHSNGFNDYFIADKAHGYWTMNRFSGAGDTLGFDMAFVKDGVGYGGYVSAFSDGSAVVSNLSVFLPSEERDLFTIDTQIQYNDLGEKEQHFSVKLHLAGVTSGIAGISTTDTQGIYSEVYGNSGTVYMMFEGNNSTTVELSNGGRIAPNTKLGEKLTYVESIISYSPEYHADCYTAALCFDITANDVSEALSVLTKYLNEQGVSLFADTAIVAEAYGHASLMAEDFGTYTSWNGYQLDSIEALAQAENALFENFNSTYALYQSVKDNERVSANTKIKSTESLTSFSSITPGVTVCDEGVITLNGLSMSINDTSLLDSGSSYSIRLGITRRDSEGQLVSMTMVPLASEGITTHYYGGESYFSVTSADSFFIPVACSEGEYVVVAYIATADEGIRVTEMAPLAVYSADEGTLNSDVMDVTLKISDEQLLVTYGIKLSAWTECDTQKSAYSYEEIYKQLLKGVLASGYPAENATAQTQDGEELSEGNSYGAGVYRLKFLTPTAHGYVEAYMYCQF